ncbi:MAG TPA: hypothetical protein VJ912_02065 [Candidatus Nanoarchaeia archaeon]|nr:hypothetical protein [Candidatus Nanoarchaeia archaeon]
MAEEQQWSQGDEYIARIRDVEEKHNVLKDRVVLIGNNLIETKEKNNNEIIEMKKEIDSLKEEMERIKDFIETLSQEMSKFAKREDLNILSKQAKMFQPANFIRKEELKEEIEKLKK